jgi:hypothetical protein
MNQLFIPGSVFLRRSQSEGAKTSPRYKKSRAIQAILEFRSSKGLTTEGSAQTSKRNGCMPYSDVLTSIAGKPVEVLVGVKRLSKPQINYGRTISNSGGPFVSVMNTKEFKARYRCKTLNPTMP